MKKYMIGLLVTNKYGVLTRIASAFCCAEDIILIR